MKVFVLASVTLAAADVDCSTAVCKSQCECSNVKCADEIATCLSDDTCSKAQDCALACACNDDACVLKCAAANPSIKAVPAAKCITKQCGNVESTGGSLALTWEDCGDASTHGKTDDIEPSEITIGQDTTITGTGSTDKEISSGTFTMKLTASMGITQTYTGKICEAKSFKIPLGLGTVSWAGMDCPVAVGPSKVVLGVKMASILPAALAKADLALVALDQDAEQAVCVNTHLKRNALTSSDVDCSTAVCKSQCECSNVKCADEIATCLSDDTCSKAQDCALACACNDDACILKCAAANPSIKAVPAAKCITKQCGNVQSTDVDCSTAVCKSQCECSNVKCADEIAACLSDDTCSKAQNCALACSCNDDACVLKCAAANPSIKAVPAAKCITKQCGNVVV